jgi:hypothetical protein
MWAIFLIPYRSIGNPKDWLYLKMKPWIFIFGLSVGAGLQAQPLPLHEQQYRIAFGAGSHPGAGQETWLNVAEHKPSHFTWVGSLTPAAPKTGSLFQQQLEKQKFHPQYLPFAQQVSISGIWYWAVPPLHEDSAKALAPKFNQFLGRVPESTTWYSQRLGPADGKIQMIHLDTWSHALAGDTNNMVLHPAQWDWLAKELQSTDPVLRVIVTGKSIHWRSRSGQSWKSFPAARRKLLDMLAAQSKPILFVSGTYPCGALSTSQWKGKNLVELHTFGLNQVRVKLGKPGQLVTLRDAFCQRNFALVTLDYREPMSLHIALQDVQNFLVWEWKGFLEDF